MKCEPFHIEKGPPWERTLLVMSCSFGYCMKLDIANISEVRSLLLTKQYGGGHQTPVKSLVRFWEKNITGGLPQMLCWGERTRSDTCQQRTVSQRAIQPTRGSILTTWGIVSKAAVKTNVANPPSLSTFGGGLKFCLPTFCVRLLGLLFRGEKPLGLTIICRHEAQKLTLTLSLEYRGSPGSNEQTEPHMEVCGNHTRLSHQPLGKFPLKL